MKFFAAILALAFVGAANADWFGRGQETVCHACEATLKALRDGVQNSQAVQQTVVQTVYGWCQKAAQRLAKPESTCDSIPQTANKVVADLLATLEPSNCQKLNLCSTISGSLSLNSINSLVRSLEQKSLNRGLDFQSIRDYVCQTCVGAITNTRDALINKLPELVEKLNLCNLLQKPELVQDCKNNIPVYAQDLANFLTGTAEPKAICAGFYLCQA